MQCTILNCSSSSVCPPVGLSRHLGTSQGRRVKWIKRRSLKSRYLGDVSLLRRVTTSNLTRRGLLTTVALFEKFTENALNSVVAAQKEAQRFRSREVRRIGLNILGYGLLGGLLPLDAGANSSGFKLKWISRDWGISGEGQNRNEWTAGQGIGEGERCNECAIQQPGELSNEVCTTSKSIRDAVYLYDTWM